jgi:hypothetical protein
VGQGIFLRCFTIFTGRAPAQFDSASVILPPTRKEKHADPLDLPFFANGKNI